MGVLDGYGGEWEREWVEVGGETEALLVSVGSSMMDSILSE